MARLYTSTSGLANSQINDIYQDIIANSFAEESRTGNILIGSFNYGILIYDNALGMIRRPKVSRFRQA